MNGFLAATTGRLMDGTANACYSPISLYMALALATMGAGGATREELLALLQCEAGGAAALEDDIQKIMGSLPFSTPGVDSEFEKASPRTLALANSVWLNDSFDFQPGFSSAAQNAFKAALKRCSFSDGDTGAQMGKWVHDNTNGLLSPSFSVDAASLMVLLNTVYLADSWVDEFQAHSNTEDDFTTSARQKRSCTFMKKYISHGAYIDGKRFSGLTLPLMGADGTSGGMTFILPNKLYSAEKLVQDPEMLRAALDTAPTGPADITFKVPKFSFGSQFSPIAALKQLGLETPFAQETAQFDALATGGAQKPFISDIKQETHIGIDENGVEAAAYTSMIVATGAGMPEKVKKVDIILDRPFLFAIRYNNLPLFVGVVDDPTQG